MPSTSLRQIVSDLRHGQVNSAAARRALGLVYQQGSVYTIPFGRLRGVRLQYDASVNFHAMLGLWETASFDLLARVFDAGVLPAANPLFCDVGANIGLYTLFFARCHPAGSVVAFEPAPVVSRLRTHLALNDVGNAVVVEQACSDQVGEATFFLGHHHHASSLNAGWAQGAQDSVQAIHVPATTLDAWFYGQPAGAGPDFIKMDIEGGGVWALKGCDRCIRERRPLFLIESHTPDEDRAISDLLIGYDYHAFRLDDQRWVSQRGQTHPEREGVWGTLLLWPAEKRGLAAKVVGSS